MVKGDDDVAIAFVCSVGSVSDWDVAVLAVVLLASAFVGLVLVLLLVLLALPPPPRIFHLQRFRRAKRFPAGLELGVVKACTAGSKKDGIPALLSCPTRSSRARSGGSRWICRLGSIVQGDDFGVSKRRKSELK